MRALQIATTFLLTVTCIGAQAPQAARPGRPAMQFPDAPGRDTVQKVCGTCHGAEVVISKGLTRPEWTQVIGSMVTRGAKGTDDEFAQVLDYLTANFPPNSKVGAPSKVNGDFGPGQLPRQVQRPSGATGVGSDDKHVVDPVAAARGKTIYAVECVNCHGTSSRGTDNGPDLTRSLVVLHDRYGNTIGPFLQKGHPMQSGGASAKLSAPQLEDLSHFLHQRVDDVLRSGPYNNVLNVLTGDANAGKAFFNGAGKCSTCHSPTGDLAAIAKKYDPPTLQQRFLFPQTVSFRRRGATAGAAKTKQVTVTVSAPSQPPVSGVLLSLDDFNVALRDSSGDYRSWKRTPDLKVEKSDPFSAHGELLEIYTDKNIHDVVAYLATLK